MNLEERARLTNTTLDKLWAGFCAKAPQHAHKMTGAEAIRFRNLARKYVQDYVLATHDASLPLDLAAARKERLATEIKCLQDDFLAKWEMER